MGRRHDNPPRKDMVCQDSIHDTARLTKGRNDNVIELRESLQGEALTPDRVVSVDDTHEALLHRRLRHEVGRGQVCCKFY
jgi:hypothetical protein